MRLVALALVAVLAVRLRQLWRDNPADLSHANAAALVLAAVFSLVAVIGYGSVWPFILRRIDAPVPSDSVRIFLQSQLGKYVPGSVWQYAGRVGLAKARGVSARLTMISLGVEVGASALAAAVVGLFVLPLSIALPIALALGAAAAVLSLARAGVPRRLAAAAARAVHRIVPLSPADLGAALRASPPVTALFFPVWAAYGLAFWLTARALFPVPASDGLYFAAAFALGWLAGMVAVFAPGGIGVREAVLVGLLGPRVGHAEAIVIAGMSRILLTGADLVGGGAALALGRLGRGHVATVAERRQ